MVNASLARSYENTPPTPSPQPCWRTEGARGREHIHTNWLAKNACSTRDREAEVRCSLTTVHTTKYENMTDARRTALAAAQSQPTQRGVVSDVDIYGVSDASGVSETRWYCSVAVYGSNAGSPSFLPIPTARPHALAHFHHTLSGRSRVLSGCCTAESSS